MHFYLFSLYLFFLFVLLKVDSTVSVKMAFGNLTIAKLHMCVCVWIRIFGQLILSLKKLKIKIGKMRYFIYAKRTSVSFSTGASFVIPCFIAHLPTAICASNNSCNRPYCRSTRYAKLPHNHWLLMWLSFRVPATP